MNESASRSATVAICGDSGYLGAAVAERLIASGARVVGFGRGTGHPHWPDDAPYEMLRRVGAELEQRLCAVRPLAVASFPWERPGRSPAADAELAVVEGAVNAGVQRLVCWGDTRVYRSDAAPDGPFLESARPMPPPLPEPPPNAWAAYEARLAQPIARHPQVAFIVLRAAPIVGLGTSSPLRELTAARVLPRVAGADPPLQFLHVDDAVEILQRALGQAYPGVYNVAGDGVILYSELCRALDGTPIRMSRGPWSLLLKVGGALRLHRFSAELLEVVTTHVVADNTRLKTHFGFRPGHSARDTVWQYLQRRRGDPLDQK